MTNFIASIASTFASFKLQRSRAAALKHLRRIRSQVRGHGAQPAPGTAFATAKGLVWGTSKFQAVDLAIRDRRTSDTDKSKWTAACTHAH